ncbi:hypothetical protein SAMN05428969_0241 [Devosia sp. YR412]|uniref:hypothetical protein n=1 Tax=Devosia sp. YR412 TaxID=1881030 RepID=UPI0008C0DC25|nr:hypothetical protein [Devosia sp. YR412]SEP63569.1 hypothetical protein SAMN05428969_0241 [Devosia sp. YR412]
MPFVFRLKPLLFVILSLGPVDAAEFTKLMERPIAVDLRGTGKCSASLIGTLETGDAEKVQQYVDEMAPFFDPGSNAPEHYESYNGDGLTLCISGPGGSYAEALKLIEVLASGFVWTVVPETADCLSACAVAFMGGLYADETGRVPARLLMAGANLGFHAPSITLSSTGAMPPQMVEAAYKTALADIQGVVSTLLVNAEFSYEASMKPSLLATMLGTPPDDMFLLTTIDELGRWGINFEDGNNDSINLSEANLIQVCKNLMSWRHDNRSISTAEYKTTGQGAMVRAEMIENNNQYSDDVLWRYTLADGMFETQCTFHVPPSLQRISDSDIQVEVWNENDGVRDSVWPDTWQYLNPNLTLIEAAVRAGYAGDTRKKSK